MSSKEKIISRYKADIENLQRTIKILEDIEVGMILLVRLPFNELIVHTHVWNKDSIRADCLAVKRPSHYTDLKTRRRNKTDVRMDAFQVCLNFRDIETWKPLDETAVPLYVNWDFLSNDFKKRYFK